MLHKIQIYALNICIVKFRLSVSPQKMFLTKDHAKFKSIPQRSIIYLVSKCYIKYHVILAVPPTAVPLWKTKLTRKYIWSFINRKWNDCKIVPTKLKVILTRKLALLHSLQNLYTSLLDNDHGKLQWEAWSTWECKHISLCNTWIKDMLFLWSMIKYN